MKQWLPHPDKLRALGARAAGVIAGKLTPSVGPSAPPIVNGRLRPGVAPMSSPQAAAVALQQVLNAQSKTIQGGTRVVNWVRGPSVIRFHVGITEAVKPASIVALEEAMAVAFGMDSGVRVVHPLSIPGVVGVEIPLPPRFRQPVPLAPLLALPPLRATRSPLLIPLGVSVEGAPIVPDLTRLPHLLIAGATNAGKSVALNTILMSIISRTTPDVVRLTLIDPKRVELTQYAGVPHLERPIVTKPVDAAMVAKQIEGEIERRYDLLEQAGCKNIAAYNARNPVSPMPYSVIVVDEYASLLDQDGAEDSFVEIARLGRGCGVHLVLATQRPDAGTVTGRLKANIPARLALAVADRVNSMVILDQKGAERLAGAGDALFSPGSAAAAIRLQVAYVSDVEIDATVARMAPRSPADPTVVPVDWVKDLEDLHEDRDEDQEASTVVIDADDLDESVQDLVLAARLVIESQLGSVSMLQRKMRVGFAKASRLMDDLERFEVVSPAEGKARPRRVLVEPESMNLALLKIVNGS